MKTTSCGILVFEPGGDLLLCHATGTSYWDIPKGAGEPGETPLQTALRETAEECGLVFSPPDLLELGRFAYRPSKDLALFAVLTERVDTALCVCSSHFRDRFGRDRPEMDGFEWVAPAQVPARCAKSMAALMTATLPLLPLFERLRARGRVAPAVRVA
jgi:putative (di)nucleoside polyphosphate hydrolase